MILWYNEMKSLQNAEIPEVNTIDMFADTVNRVIEFYILTI